MLILKNQGRIQQYSHCHQIQMVLHGVVVVMLDSQQHWMDNGVPIQVKKRNLFLILLYFESLYFNIFHLKWFALGDSLSYYFFFILFTNKQKLKLSQQGMDLLLILIILKVENIF